MKYKSWILIIALALGHCLVKISGLKLYRTVLKLKGVCGLWVTVLSVVNYMHNNGFIMSSSSFFVEFNDCKSFKRLITIPRHIRSSANSEAVTAIWSTSFPYPHVQMHFSETVLCPSSDLIHNCTKSASANQDSAGHNILFLLINSFLY